MMLRTSARLSARPLTRFGNSAPGVNLVLVRSFNKNARTPISISLDESTLDEVAKGREGPHPEDPRLSKAHTAPQHFRGKAVDTTKAGTAPMPVGDWVMMHPVYTPAEVADVHIVHRPTRNVRDSLALASVKLLRTTFDFISSYSHKPLTKGAETLSVEDMRTQGYTMGPQQWLMRFIFLESVAGVPGMVGGTLRHLRSLRMMKRDGGWIHTLLEESENERMHLMTFMTLKNPSMLFRAGVLFTQGIFYNAFFFVYLLSPKAAHRFVGHLEEEAVKTYTLAIEDLEKGRIPEWSNSPAPEIAIDYWRLEKNAKLLDVLKAIRADEATHRFVNHSLANLEQDSDVNPFSLREPSMHLKGKSLGLERSEAADFVNATHELLKSGHEQENKDKAQ